MLPNQRNSSLLDFMAALAGSLCGETVKSLLTRSCKLVIFCLSNRQVHYNGDNAFFI